MGFTGLACWINAPTNGVEIIRDHITKNHSGHLIGRWYLQVRSYRSVLNTRQTQAQQPPRSMIAVTMNDSVFALIEDPSVPMSDLNPPGSPDVPLAAGEQPSSPPKHVIPEEPEERPHRRWSFVIIKPPDSLELLLQQLQAKWVPVRQSSGSANAKQGPAGPQVTVEGLAFSVGTDWIVRAGNVLLAGGSVRGMLLEAEYLPLPHSPQPVLTENDTADLLSNLLTSMLPSTPGSRTIVFPIVDAQWDDVLFDTDDREQPNLKREAESEDSICISAKDAIPKSTRGDWTGIYRDQRSAFMVIGALKSEGTI